jgi:hypothetical protein
MNVSKKILYAIIVVFIVFSAVFWQINSFKEQYQAVFLSNNQVYFGKLKLSFGRFVVLEDVYYLRVAQELQQNSQATSLSQIQLVKLGSEIHGPTPEMKINRGQILFVEDLKGDSEVVKAILDRKNKEN